MKESSRLSQRVASFGEETHKTVGYFAATSRKLGSRLHRYQSVIGGGKSSLMRLCCRSSAEEQSRLLAMTGPKAVLHGRKRILKTKSLSIAEEEGLAQGNYAHLKAAPSEGPTDDRQHGQRSPAADEWKAEVSRRRP